MPAADDKLRILILQGHPDPGQGHLCEALAKAYGEAAAAAGHAVEWLEVGRLDFPLLRRKADFETPEALPPSLAEAQAAIGRSDHLLLVYPLWLGGMPALLKGFLEQVLRPGFAFAYRQRGWERRLKGRSARVVVTMGMPALAYRCWFGAHGLKALRRSILGFCGFRPLRSSLFGMVEQASDAKRAAWLEKMARLGRSGR